MATQGLISIVSNKKVIMKIVCGCDGYNFPYLVKELRKYKENFNLSGVQAYNLAKRYKFSCDKCLYIITESGIFGKLEDDYKIKDVEHSNEFDNHLYRETFNKAKFNPRWALGTADYTIVINIEKRGN